MSYDPNTSRWTAHDPIGFSGGDADLYRYVGNAPTLAVDPGGEQDEQLPPRIDLPGAEPILPGPVADPGPLRDPWVRPYDIVQWPNNPTCLPSPPADWMQDPDVQNAIKQAWKDTGIFGNEQGFFVIWNPQTGDVTITRSGNKRIGRAKGKMRVTPPRDISKVSDDDPKRKEGPPLDGYCIIAWFHTHPDGSLNPSGADLDLGKHIIVPKFIIPAPDVPPVQFP